MKMNTARRMPPARLVVVGISLAAGIGAAVLASGSSVEHEGTIGHEDMEEWINSWGTESELTAPKPES
jgi:hypothetical protein